MIPIKYFKIPRIGKGKVIAMKIVVLDGYTLNPGDLTWNALEQLGDLTVYDRTPKEEILPRSKDADILFTNKTPLREETLRQCKNLKFIGMLSTGYDVVDVSFANANKIIVSNIPAYGTESVSQFTIGLLLELCHHIGEHSQSVKNGEWAKHQDWCFWNYPLVSLAGKTMGIIGFGRIGQCTAKIAQALGMNILAYDSFQNPQLVSDTCHYTTIDHLFANADVIALHCLLNEDTRGIINKNTLSKMKPNALLLNAARGELIIEEDVKDALNQDKIAGYACDVVSSEPIHKDNPLLQAKNVIITPHIAWAPKEARQKLMQCAADNLQAFLDGKPINVVSV